MIGTESRASVARAGDLMSAFAEDTGLVGSRGQPVRYLWTDAFAVCNFLALGDTELALRLVDQVHRTLGRRDPRHGEEGWLSGLDDEAAEKHPTWGGLRIGKKMAERLAGDPIDERLEWDRDGQYFHYLTKWMHALDQVARATGESRFNVWARELSEVAFRSFTYVPTTGLGGFGGRRMHWKMSVDLTRPLVPSMGHHDPLDGYVTFRQLHGTADFLGVANVGPTLAVEAAELSAMIPDELATSDPLGIGGLLADAWRVEQLARDGAISGPGLRDRLVEASLVGLEALGLNAFRGPADYRLAFRELGLAIGLAAVPLLGSTGDALSRFAPLREDIEAFWLEPVNRRSSTWLEHEHINLVMLATSLVPDGYLKLGGVSSTR
jgi:hypothetical protein